MSRDITPAQMAAVRERMSRLTPDRHPLWGTMTPHEAVCHLSDALRHPLGDRSAVIPPPSWFRHVLLKWLVLWVIPRYPKGAKTKASFDPRREGTKPGDFARDVAALDALTEQFILGASSIKVEHTRFGPMRERDWLRWWWMHTDHHLRQFGV